MRAHDRRVTITRSALAGHRTGKGLTMAKQKEKRSRAELDAERQAEEKRIAAEEREEAEAAAEEESAAIAEEQEEYVTDPETGETRERDWDNDPEPDPRVSGRGA